jgi:hypothetical protein
MTTYGTWLRGDARGWVDDGVTFPPNAVLESYDRSQLTQPPYYFPPAVRDQVGRAMGESLIKRLNLAIYALCVQSWHCHFVVGSSDHDPAAVIKCAKDAVRWELRIGGRIWGTGYDKRFCVDAAAVRARVAYVEKHNLRDGIAARPWAFITDFV